MAPPPSSTRTSTSACFASCACRPPHLAPSASSSSTTAPCSSASALLAIRIAVVPPESCGDASLEAIDGAAHEAIDWIRRNQRPDGTYLYIYNSEFDSNPDEYNEVRHAGVTMALYQAAGRYGDREFLAAGDRGLDWMVDRLVHERGWAALAPDNQRAKLGASALMAAALIERRLATGETQYDDLMRGLGRFLLTLQRDDGGFSTAWLVNSDAPEYGTSSRYYPGEASWALALMASAFPGEDWQSAAIRGLRFLATERDQLENVDFPPLADQWAAYTLAALPATALRDQEIDYARRLAARFGLLVRVEAQRQDSWLGRAVRGRESRAAGAGTWLEGLGALWSLSASVQPLADIRPKIEERLTCVAGIMAARQVDELEAMSYPRPDLAQGAWFRAGETRMDNQQHAFSGLLYAADALRSGTDGERTSALPLGEQ